MAKGSLLPENAVGGGAIPDGEYRIASAAAQMFNYGGTQNDTPAICIVYEASDGALLEQNYTAGKESALHASNDGKRFERISRNSNAWLWLGSILSAGFPKDKVDEDVSVFEGTKVQLVNQAQPKRPGIKDEKEGKTIPLVTKVLSLPGEKHRPTLVGKASPSPTAPISPSSNGALDAAAVEAVQLALAEAPGNKMTRVKLGTTVMLRLSKEKNPQMAAIKKLASDAAWLAANAEAGGWSSDGSEVTLG